jgi:hypothetical protein
MALVVKDRVQETTTTTGTGTVTLAGAVTGFQSFSVIGNGNTTYYSIAGGSEWELGIGTYTSSGTTLSRDTVLESSNSGSLVNFSAGTKTVFCTYPAERSMYVDGTTITPATTATLPIISGGTGAATLDANNVILGNGTSAVQFVAPGTNGNVLTSNGTTWTSAAAGGGGGSFVFLSSAVAATSVIDFTGLNTTTYSSFLITFTDVRAASLGCRLYPGGTLATGGVYGYIGSTLDTGASPTVTSFTSGSTSILLDGGGGTTANLGRSGWLWFYPAGGYSNVMYQSTIITATNSMNSRVANGYINNASESNGIRIGTQTIGNLTGGNFWLYGLKAS